MVQHFFGGKVGIGATSPYGNEAPSNPLSGTVTVEADSVNVTGVDTLFTQELAEGHHVSVQKFLLSVR